MQDFAQALKAMKILNGKTVVVVDDEEMIVEMVGDILKNVGATVYATTVSARAVGVLQNMKVDLVVLDREMPELDGISILKMIKKDPKLARLPVIMLTGAKTKEEIQEAINAGADGYVTKPFSPAILMKQIKIVLEKYKDFWVVED